MTQRIAAADRIVATNWATGYPGFSLPISGNNVRKIIHAVSISKRCANQEHPVCEWDWKLLFYTGTNLLDSICFARDTFLTDAVYLDESGVLEGVYSDSNKREYLARIYGDQDETFTNTITVEARQWLRSPLHTILGEDKKKVIKYVNEFYDAGARKVCLANIKTELNGKNPPTEHAMFMCVVLPQDSEARRKVFRVHSQAVTNWCNDADDDVGQKYLWYQIDWHEFK
jgi:hypothetical protein